jgi:hypothetical protein
LREIGRKARNTTMRRMNERSYGMNMLVAQSRAMKNLLKKNEKKRRNAFSLPFFMFAPK